MSDEQSIRDEIARVLNWQGWTCEGGWSTTDRQAASAEAHRRFDEWAETRGQDIAGASINGFILGAEWWKSHRTVQRGPSDAVVARALEAYWGPQSTGFWFADQINSMRAALRAAAEEGKKR